MFGAFGSRVKTWFGLGAGSIAAILVAGLLGAFGALPEPEAPVFAAGSRIETGQWIVVPHGAYVGGSKVFGVPIGQGQKALVVEAELTNRTAVSSKDYFSLLRPAGTLGEKVDVPFIVLLRDAYMAPELHPAMPERMAYIWSVPVATALPAQLSFTVNTKTYKQRDNLYGTPGWFNERVQGHVMLPVGTSGP